MEKTQYYELGKPLDTEFYDVGVQNNNMDVVDEKIHENAESIHNLNTILPLKADLIDGKVPTAQLPAMDYDSSGTATTKVNQHNGDKAAHPYLLQQLSACTNAIQLANDAANSASAAANIAQKAANSAQSAANSVSTQVDTHTKNWDNPHGVTAEQVGALPTSGGGIVYGHVRSVLGGSPSVQSAGGGYVGTENGAYVEAYNDATDVYGERRQIVLVPSTKDSDINTALRIAELRDGKWSSHFILHTGNKSCIAPQDIGAATNPNLLDNWYFADPINQRGQTEYTKYGYTIDRWLSSQEATLSVVDGGIIVRKGNYLHQRIENGFSFGGKTVTLSVLLETGLFWATGTLPNFPTITTEGWVNHIVVDHGDGTVTVLEEDGALQGLNVNIRSSSEKDVPKAIAIKLELGTKQTLAYQDASGNWVLLDPPPNKHMELLKCCMSTADSTDTYANNYRTIDAISRLCTFSFSNNNSTYQARTGMTWQTWIDSSYNTNKLFSYSGNYVEHKYYTGCDVLNSSNQCVKSTDLIIPFETYLAFACCFIAGTQVLVDMDGNTRAIETLTAGDSVVSYNVETGSKYIAKVKKLIVNQNTTDMAEITFANGSTLVQNAYHAVYCDDGFHSITQYNGYKELVVGDRAKTTDGWSEVIAIRRYTSDPIVTYNLDVVDIGEDPDDDTNDTYYANGIVVHNAGCK